MLLGVRISLIQRSRIRRDGMNQVRQECFPAVGRTNYVVRWMTGFCGEVGKAGERVVFVVKVRGVSTG